LTQRTQRIRGAAQRTIFGREAPKAVSTKQATGPLAPVTSPSRPLRALCVLRVKAFPFFSALAYPSSWVLTRRSGSGRGRGGAGAAQCSSRKIPCQGAELDLASADRDRQLQLGQRALQMRRHIVGPLIVVAVEGRLLGRQPRQKGGEVAQDVGRIVLLDQQRGRGVRDKDG